jgi:uncharacterized membrane protein YczE
MSKLYAEKLARCIAGLAFFGFGITLFIRANLGLAPWDIFHKGLSEKLDVSIGLVIVGVGLLLLLLWIPLRQKPGVGTVLNALEIGFVVNLTKPLIGEPDQLVMSTFMVIALGSALYIGAGLGSGPRDGLMLGLSQRSIGGRRISIRVARTTIELTVMIAGLFLGGSIGIGTLIFMFGIGPLVQLVLPRFEMRLASDMTATAQS